jgi:hypothetical protein
MYESAICLPRLHAQRVTHSLDLPVKVRGSYQGPKSVTPTPVAEKVIIGRRPLPPLSAPSTPTPNAKFRANARGPVLDLQALPSLKTLLWPVTLASRVQKRLHGTRHL